MIVARYDSECFGSWIAIDVVVDVCGPENRDWSIYQIASLVMESMPCDGVYLVCPD